MTNVLTESEIDPITEQVDAVLTQAEEDAASQRFAPTPNPGDLSNGGMVNGVRLTPMSGWNGGKRLEKGRAAARRAWMWNGTESLLPLAWNPDGTIHDGARRYLLKRFCLCCHSGGFRGSQCPNCAKRNCERCAGSTDNTLRKTPSGKMVKTVIPCFYLRKEDVPFPERFYGEIDCFHPFCVRKGSLGFKTDQDMRVHARTRHRMEYQAHVETLAAETAAKQVGRDDELASLRKRLDAFVAPGSQKSGLTKQDRRLLKGIKAKVS